ncbi:MAG: hypothetical protein IT561_28515 [Alphaproteobacteria bacterium]|nr:hypothetical protein [Alphaproteobacteria bacterium]
MMLVETAGASGVACELCRGATTPISTGHSANPRMRAYECLACGHEQIRIAPARVGRSQAATPPALLDVA